MAPRTGLRGSRFSLAARLLTVVGLLIVAAGPVLGEGFGVDAGWLPVVGLAAVGVGALATARALSSQAPADLVGRALGFVLAGGLAAFAIYQGGYLFSSTGETFVLVTGLALAAVSFGFLVALVHAIRRAAAVETRPVFLLLAVLAPVAGAVLRPDEPSSKLLFVTVPGLCLAVALLRIPRSTGPP